MSTSTLAISQEMTENEVWSYLKRTLESMGLFVPQTKRFIATTVVVVSVALAGFIAAPQISNVWLLLAVAFGEGICSTQIALLSHDLGHRQVFDDRKRTSYILHLVYGNFFLAFSNSWWVDKHDRHHANPNHLEKDPDVQIAFIAFRAEQAIGRSKWLRPLMKTQALVFPLVLCLQAVNARWSSITYLFKDRPKDKWLQLSIILVHVIIYAVFLVHFLGGQNALFFALVHQGIFGLYNSAVFAPNHKLAEFLKAGHAYGVIRKQVLTSTNVTGGSVIDAGMGGLNYQIEHHLFPKLPRWNLAKAHAVIEPALRQYGIEYQQDNIFRSWLGIEGKLFRESRRIGKDKAA